MKKVLRVIGLLLIICLGAFGFTACGDEIADNTKYYDSITKTLKLEKTYKDKNFYTQGIGEATLEASVDGDTSRFTLATGGSITIRYYEIDTPESTGGVEKWGKSASLFAKSKLEAATELVLEASETPAVKDSYGSRYLGYVWYKTADDGEFKCLNLEMVENGFSDNKGNNTNAYPYYQYFKQANDFARKIQLRLYSKLDDPLYSDAPVDITLKEFSENPDLYYNKETESGAKVRFTAYLTSLKISDTGTHTFVAEQYDAETGEIYKINVYAGYGSAAASRMKLGNLFRIVGSVQDHYGTLQVSGLTYETNASLATSSDTIIKQNKYYLTFDSTVKYGENYSLNFYTDLTVTQTPTVEGTVMTLKASAQKLTDSGNGEEETFTFKVNVSAGYTPTLKAGDKFSTHAYNFDSTKFDSTKDVLTILSINDIVKR